MADSRFFTRHGPFTLAQLAEVSGADIADASQGDTLVEDVAPLGDATANQISFLDNPKYQAAFTASSAGACVVSEKYRDLAPNAMALLISEQPYRAYAIIASTFYPPPQKALFHRKQSLVSLLPLVKTLLFTREHV